MYAYGSWADKEDPAYDCWASPHTNVPYIPRNNEMNPPKDFVNVSDQFELVIKWGFFNALATILFLIPYGTWKQMQPNGPKIFDLMNILVNLSNFGQFIA